MPLTLLLMMLLFVHIAAIVDAVAAADVPIAIGPRYSYDDSYSAGSNDLHWMDREYPYV